MACQELEIFDSAGPDQSLPVRMVPAADTILSVKSWHFKSSTTDSVFVNDITEAFYDPVTPMHVCVLQNQSERITDGTPILQLSTHLEIGTVKKTLFALDH